MRTRARRTKKRTPKRKTYKKRGGFWNDPSSELSYKWITDSAPYTSK